MNIFFWRKNKVIDEFAYQLADELFSHINPESMALYLRGEHSTEKTAPKKADKTRQRITQTLNNIIIRVQQFRQLHALGIYGKARLHLTFTERLRELGYSAKLAEETNKLILMHTP